MANLIIKEVANLTDHDIPLHVPGYASTHEDVVIPASGSLVLLGPMTADELLGIQPALQGMVDAGALSVSDTVDSETFVI